VKLEFFQLECKQHYRVLQIGMKYSMHHQICGVVMGLKLRDDDDDNNNNNNNNMATLSMHASSTCTITS